MDAITFTGRKLYNNIKILGDPMQDRTTAPDDINYLNKIQTMLNTSEKSEFKREYIGSSVNEFGSKDYHFSFGQSGGFTNFQKIFIKDYKENITRIFTKDEFPDKAYSNAFKNCLESIRSVLTKF